MYVCMYKAIFYSILHCIANCGCINYDSNNIHAVKLATVVTVHMTTSL